MGADLPSHSDAFRRRRFLNWFPLGLTYATFYMGRYNFNASKDTIEGLYGLTKAQSGTIASTGFIVYALSVFVNGPLADRLGGRRAILLGAFGACALNAAIALMFGAHWDGRIITVMSALYGVNMYFQSFGALSVVKVNAAWFHVRERGVLGGWFGTMISLGYFFALGIGGFIVAKLPLFYAYLIPSGVILAMALVDLAVVRDRPSGAGFADFATGDEDPSAAATPSGPEPEPRFFDVVKLVFKNPVLRVMAMAEFCTGLVRQGLLLYFGQFLKEVHHVAKASFGYEVASTGITVGGIVGALACGFLSDRVFSSRRTPVAFIFYLGQIVSLLALGWVTSPTAAVYLVPVCAMWIFGVHGMLTGAASMDFGGKKAAATAAGLLDGVQYLGSGLTGVGLGALLDKYHWGIWTVSLAPFSAVGALLMLWLWNATPGGAHAAPPPPPNRSKGAARH